MPKIEHGYLNKTIVRVQKPSDEHIFVSYSQLSLFDNCPLQWKLKYVDKIKLVDESIHTVFGTAIHTTIQNWIVILYTETVKKFNEFDFEAAFLAEMKSEYLASVKKNNDVHFSTKEQLSEYYLYGVEILKYLKSKRKLFFDRKNEELIGIEMPLYNKIGGVCFVSYLDAVFREKTTGKIIIRDFKTSRSGWKYEKTNFIKTSQLVLYKMFYSELYDVPIDDIEIEYIILKRIVNTDLAYPIPRVSKFSPASGTVTRNKVKRLIDNFIESCFDNGKYKIDQNYLAIAGINNYNCKFCPYSIREDLCPVKNRLK